VLNGCLPTSGARSVPFLNSGFSDTECPATPSASLRGPVDCKPVSVPDKGRWPFIWAKHFCLALATYPRVERSGQLLPSYLVLLRMGFTLPARIAPAAVRSYRTFSPLPPAQARKPAPRAVYFLWHFP
jgi:hypothetical protein